MAKEIIQRSATWCDLHKALPQEIRAPAATERRLGNDKAVDLCHPCALIFDIYYPRRDELAGLLTAEVLDHFYGSARSTAKPAPRLPARLGLAEQKALPPGTAEPKSQTPSRGKKAVPNGEWNEDVIQVRCPLDHRPGSPAEYWVALRDRGGHARAHKKPDGERYSGPQIPFELQEFDVDGKTPLKWTHFCFDHQDCAEAGGYGFLSPEAVTLHCNKTRNWPAADPKVRDAAKTRLGQRAA